MQKWQMLQKNYKVKDKISQVFIWLLFLSESEIRPIVFIHCYISGKYKTNKGY